jgi:hypothetical protein
MFEEIALTVRKLFGDESSTPDTAIELAKRLQSAEAERSAAERNAQELRVRRAITGRPTLATIDEAINKAASYGDDCAALEAALRERLERLPASVSDAELAAEKDSLQRADTALRAKVLAAQRRMTELAGEMIQIALANGAQFYRGARTNYSEAAAGAIGYMDGIALELPGIPRIPGIDPTVFEQVSVSESGFLRDQIKTIMVRRQSLSGPGARASVARARLQTAGADDLLLAMFDKTIAAQPVAEVVEEVKPPAPQRTGAAVKYLDPATGKTRVAHYGGIETAITAWRGLRAAGMKNVERGWGLEGEGFEPIANKPTEPPAIAVDDVEADQS